MWIPICLAGLEKNLLVVVNQQTLTLLKIVLLWFFQDWAASTRF
jgi:hypothetical protein